MDSSRMWLQSIERNKMMSNDIVLYLCSNSRLAGRCCNEEVYHQHIHKSNTDSLPELLCQQSVNLDHRRRYLRKFLLGCNGYLAYPFKKMTISSFPSISILAKWNSMKEEARVFSVTYYCGRMRITIGILYYPEGIVSDCEL